MGRGFHRIGLETLCCLEHKLFKLWLVDFKIGQINEVAKSIYETEYSEINYNLASFMSSSITTMVFILGLWFYCITQNLLGFPLFWKWFHFIAQRHFTLYKMIPHLWDIPNYYCRILTVAWSGCCVNCKNSLDSYVIRFRCACRLAHSSFVVYSAPNRATTCTTWDKISENFSVQVMELIRSPLFSWAPELIHASGDESSWRVKEL